MIVDSARRSRNEKNANRSSIIIHNITNKSEEEHSGHLSFPGSNVFHHSGLEAFILLSGLLLGLDLLLLLEPVHVGAEEVAVRQLELVHVLRMDLESKRDREISNKLLSQTYTHNLVET